MIYPGFFESTFHSRPSSSVLWSHAQAIYRKLFTRQWQAAAYGMNHWASSQLPSAGPSRAERGANKDGTALVLSSLLLVCALIQALYQRKAVRNFFFFLLSIFIILITSGQVRKRHQHSCKITCMTSSVIYLIAINEMFSITDKKKTQTISTISRTVRLISPISLHLACKMLTLLRCGICHPKKVLFHCDYVCVSKT